MVQTKRQLSPYEKTHLARFGQSQIKLEDFGEMPVEYITGKCEFLGKVFNVSSDVLIPRVETEELVELVVADLSSRIANLEATSLPHLKIADVGCGCGAIGLSIYGQLKSKFSNLKLEVWLADVSSPAVAVAQENQNQLFPDQSQDFHFVVSDLLTDFESNLKFDLMTANLPYIPQERVDHLDESVKDFEPHLALTGGPEGLSLIKRFLKQVPDFSHQQTTVWLEIDHTHDLADIAEFTEFDKKLIQDENGQNRFFKIQSKSY